MHASPSAEEQRANATYDALLWALSRPGQVRSLPGDGEDQIIEALLDRECRAYAADASLAPAIMRSGAELTGIEAADHVFLGDLDTLAPLARIAQGSDLYPDDGATVILRADLSQGDALRLSGPGVNGTLDVQIGGVPQGIWAERAQRIRYPVGFEMFLIDGARVMGLPRSTSIEVL